MIRMFVVLFTVFSFFFAGAADAAAPGCKPPDSYAVPAGRDVAVEAGDNAWELAAFYYGDPTLWRRVIKDNPTLAEPWRMGTMSDGRPRLILCPGEPLRGLWVAGIDPASFKRGGAGGPGGPLDLTGIPSRFEREGLLPVEPQYGAFDRFVLGGWGNALNALLWLIAGMGLAALLILIIAYLSYPNRRRGNAEPTEIPRVPEVRAEPTDLAGPPFVAPTPAPATATAAPAVQLATVTQKVPLWIAVRCGPDGKLSTAVSGSSIEAGGEVVRVVEIKLPIRVAVQLDSQGRLGAAALGVVIPETAASAEAGTTASADATAATSYVERTIL